ncbi:MAG: 30S ribosomal protein S14 [Gammaproteobacteria bacterium]|nr:30S ribosomal protein S14 [Gammaproteobacteria bacterium]
MARKSVVNRNEKRRKIIAKYAAKRAALKATMADQSASPEERMEARKRFQALPRDASDVRLVNRCRVTGRPHAVYRKFGLSRIKLREAAMRGDVPGMVKSSW